MRALLASLIVLLPISAAAQGVKQSGTVGPGRPVMWYGNAIIRDAFTPAGVPFYLPPLPSLQMTGPLYLASWTTAKRPTHPAPGVIGFNTTTQCVDQWTGTSWASLCPS